MVCRVTVAGDAIRLMSDLSEKLGLSKSQVLELALAQLEERIFWKDVRDAFERSAADAQESRSLNEVWAQGTERDLERDAW